MSAAIFPGRCDLLILIAGSVERDADVRTTVARRTTLGLIGRQGLLGQTIKLALLEREANMIRGVDFIRKHLYAPRNTALGGASVRLMHPDTNARARVPSGVTSER